MTTGGTKRFSVTMGVPKEYQKYSMRTLEGIFQDMCDTAIKDAHKANADVHITLEGKRCTFQVLFGVRREETEELHLIVSKLAEAALHTWLSKELQKLADKSVQINTDRYERLCSLKTKKHISVKPKEHIKLC